MPKTKIAWTQQSVNPIGGCDRKKVSAGCANCYAERMAWRQAHMGTDRYVGLIDDRGWTGKTFFHPEALKAFNTKTPTEFFVVSMGDMFAESVAWGNQYAIIDAIAKNPQHKYIILTKRYQSMWSTLVSLIDAPYLQSACIWPGFSVCNQKDFDKAMVFTDKLLKADWPLWLSCEPLLGPIDLHGLPVAGVVCGGESGPGARPMHPDWARSLRDQCAKADVPFFFKQWGKWIDIKHWAKLPPNPDGPTFESAPKLGQKGRTLVSCHGHSKETENWACANFGDMILGNKKINGRILDGATHDALPWRTA